MSEPDRRAVCAWGLAAALAASCGAPARAAPALGPARPFSFDRLARAAERAARVPFIPPDGPEAAALDAIDYAAHWRIRYRPEEAVRLAGGAAPVEFFHLGRYAREPVAIHRVENGEARPLDYDPALFAIPSDSPAHRLGSAAGFAGLRVMRPGGPDWLSFLGASYFRCDGPERQYGLSARGLAIDTGLSRPEEFPRFSAFWLADGEREGEDVAIYALLDSPSVAGAYRIGATRAARGFEGQRLAVEARLFFREGVERLGLAPLTSMYWFSESNRAGADDWRPEVHDSDGLALATGAGERLWRPLRNPRRVTTTTYADDGPRGFGLIQRDRGFDNYQDDGVYYGRRPSAWVRPQGDWGRGAVALVEIPTEDETFDNIVAFWSPERAPAAGDSLDIAYDLEWRARDPEPEGLGRVTATRVGRGGVPGTERPADARKFVVDFAGGALGEIGEGVEPVVEAGAGGAVVEPFTHALPGGRGWRLTFDLAGADSGPVDLRAHLRRGDAALTETWIMLADDARSA